MHNNKNKITYKVNFRNLNFLDYKVTSYTVPYYFIVSNIKQKVSSKN